MLLGPSSAAICDSPADKLLAASDSWQSLRAEIWNSSSRLVVASSSTGLNGDDRSDSPLSSPRSFGVVAALAADCTAKLLPVFVEAGSRSPEVGDVDVRRSPPSDRRHTARSE